MLTRIGAVKRGSLPREWLTQTLRGEVNKWTGVAKAAA
jgi:hypothetical protein